MPAHPARLKEPFLFTHSADDAFVDALANAARDNAKSMVALHDAVTNCVMALKKEGMQCEAALLTMKAYTKHTAFLHRERGSDRSEWSADLLVNEIAQWSIVEFYREVE
jgi:enamine deaminase RidA (YjgF/YER057c/UK114 family)